MSTNLNTFIDEVITELATVTGLKQVGRGPNALTAWPAVPVYSASGRVEGNMGKIADWEHDVRVGLLGPYDGDVGKIQAALAPLLEPLVEALMTKMLAQEYTSIDHFGAVDYVFGPIEWAGTMHFGFLLTIYDVTIRRIMT